MIGPDSRPRVYLAQFTVDAIVGAYDRKRGWAAPGHAWLLPTVRYTGVSEPLDRSGWRLDLDLGRELTLAGEGVTGRPVKEKISVFGGTEQGCNTAIDIAEPRRLTAVTLTLTAGGTLVTGAGGRPRTTAVTENSVQKLALAA